MNVKNFLFKKGKGRVWFITSVSLMSFFLAASLVVTQVDIISGTFNIIFGGKRPIVGTDYNLYEPDYKNKNDVLKAANDFNVEIVEEGITLLKNESNALPLSKNAKVTVFGKNSVNLVYGGTGSGGGSGGADAKTLYQSLEDAGITYNKVVYDFYKDNSKSGSGRQANPGMGDIVYGLKIGETPRSSYTTTIKDSYKNYNDAAIVVISRIGGEGFDLPRTMRTGADVNSSKIDGARNSTDHYLQLDQNESDMLKEACENFDKVIVLLNTSQPLELGFLDDPNHYAYNDKIKACLWMGLPGNTGVMAVGKVLTGEVNPSGHLTDTYYRDFKKDPTWYNFGNNNIADGNSYLLNGANSGYYYVDYEEGLNVGYRYYETRYYEELKKNPDTTWYEDNVIYPFGYGLSYTNFSWNIKSCSPDINSSITDDTEITIEVEVTNNGDVAGKDVVELFYTAPYTEGEIEKSYKVLGDFAKTSLIEPKKSEIVTLKISGDDMKSYDYSDANKNGFKGYELEQGEYELHIAKNAHEDFSSIKFNVDNDIKIEKDNQTETTVSNQFDDVSEGLDQIMSRSNYEGTMPTTPTEEDRSVDQAFIDSLKWKKPSDESNEPYYSDKMPTQASSEIPSENIKVKLRDLIGKDYDDPLWDELLNQLTVSQMTRLIGTGAYGTIDIANIGKPLTYEPDGPSGFTNFMTDGGPVYDTCSYATECVIGATWSKDIARRMGEMIGNEALVGDNKGSGLPYSGWYAPAINIHRSPFSGRNWEYYSEDAYLSGALAVEVVKGAKEKGVYTFVKHFAANDQETNRDTNGCLVWVDEQTFREIYLKPFEMVVKEGKTTAMMSSFNRIGKTWTGGSYPLLTQVLRNEWGFEGMVVTDYNLVRYMNVEQMIRAGGDLVLNQGNKAPSATDTSSTQVTCIRKATKNILYTVANSNAMNYDIVGYGMPIWQLLLIGIDVTVVLAIAIWGSSLIVAQLKKEKKQKEPKSN